MKDSRKATTTFWVISVLALIWNIMGVIAYLGQAYMTDETFATLSEGDQAYHTNAPAWITAVFAIAVFSGLIGCVGLLMRKKWANPLFLLSFLMVVVQFVYNFFIQEFMSPEGMDWIWSAVIIIIAGFLVAYAKKCTARGWIS